MLDNWLNAITMYRLTLYYLLALVGWGFFFQGPRLLFSSVFLVAVAYISNKIFARTFAAVTNIESVYITALILALIISPPATAADYFFLFWAAVLAMAGKYIFAFRGKHLFNPAALAVILTSVFLGRSASWWVGTASMLLPVTIGGILIMRKTDRTNMVLSFLTVSMLTILALSSGLSLRVLTETPLLFFAFVMLTEPLTTPPTRLLRIVYAVLVGVLFYSTPELALILGNIFSFAVSLKGRLVFRLKKKTQLAPDIFSFIFEAGKSFNFRPGQYLEWTLGHPGTDLRGNRRYFTLASSPTEKDVLLGVKFAPSSSSFKNALLALKPGDVISAANLAGDFTLPQDKNRKLVFIAGGIGITPFRSMLKYLLDLNQPRDITLLYSATTDREFVYSDVIDRAVRETGLRVYYSNHRYDAQTITSLVPDWKDRTFLLSGPHAMTQDFKKNLDRLGVQGVNIRTDFFPGF